MFIQTIVNKELVRAFIKPFFEEIRNENRSKVRCITSPVNRTSIAYHTKIGFSIEAGDKIVDGISVQSNYDGPGQDRVLFMKELT